MGAPRPCPSLPPLWEGGRSLSLESNWSLGYRAQRAAKSGPHSKRRPADRAQCWRSSKGSFLSVSQPSPPCIRGRDQPSSGTAPFPQVVRLLACLLCLRPLRLPGPQGDSPHREQRQDPSSQPAPRKPWASVSHCRDLRDVHPFHGTQVTLRYSVSGQPHSNPEQSLSSCLCGEQAGCQAQAPQRHRAPTRPEDKQCQQTMASMRSIRHNGVLRDISGGRCFAGPGQPYSLMGTSPPEWARRCQAPAERRWATGGLRTHLVPSRPHSWGSTRAVGTWVLGKCFPFQRLTHLQVGHSQKNPDT